MAWLSGNADKPMSMASYGDNEDMYEASESEAPTPPESLKRSSPDGTPSQGDSPNKRSREDDGSSNTMIVRFLVSNQAAGPIIGKGGSTITEYQVQSGARIQVSKNTETFRGTNDRVLSLTGTVNAILTALHLILTKLLTEDTVMDGSGVVNVKLIVPSKCCGALIGKGGTTIRTFTEDSGATIKLSPLDTLLPGMTERLMTISGTVEQQLRAMALIITKLSEDTSYTLYCGSPMTFSSNTPIAYPSHLLTQSVGSSRSQVLQAIDVTLGGPTTSVTVAVPDKHIGAIVGRGGSKVLEIESLAGVRVKISDRGDFVPGTTNRKVTIFGSSKERIQMAQLLISQKVQASASDFVAAAANA
eukprot:jgi/Chlat1/5574/Chrsp369S05404